MDKVQIRPSATKDTLTITLTPELRAILDSLTKTEGMLPEGLIQQAVQDLMFVNQFRSLRSQLIQKAQAECTDNDTIILVE